jgi:hypothetical protein
MQLSTTHQQPDLFQVYCQTEIDGVEMGVLSNGVPYLSGRGLARMCGIDHAVLHRMAANWNDEKHKPRGSYIATILGHMGFFGESLYSKALLGGVEVNAYTEPVCMAILEYYAFNDKRDQAYTSSNNQIK